MNTHTSATDITDKVTDLAEAKRDALRARIEANERRIAERTLADDARDAAKAAADYTRANPGKVVAGALAVGIVVGLMTAPGRRLVANAASSVTGKKAKPAAETGGRFGALFANAFVAQGLKLLDDVLEEANTGKEHLDELADKFADKVTTSAEKLGREAVDNSREMARRTRERAESAAREIAERVKG
ncbi:MAG: hypothetical protein ACXIT4_07875 [Erythrobacter sp.]